MDLLTDVKIKKEPTVKPAMESKTLWLNGLTGLFMFAGTFIPALKPYLTPQFMTTLFAIGNIILRFYTEDKIVVSKSTKLLEKKMLKHLIKLLIISSSFLGCAALPTKKPVEVNWDFLSARGVRNDGLS